VIKFFSLGEGVFFKTGRQRGVGLPSLKDVILPLLAHYFNV